MPTLGEIAARLGDETLTILDVRTPEEYSGQDRNACDPRQGHIPGARNVDVEPPVRWDRGSPLPPERVPRARRPAGRRRDRRVLSLGLALRPRDARPSRGGLQRAELSRLLARVEPPRRAPARAARQARPPGEDRLDVAAVRDRSRTPTPTGRRGLSPRHARWVARVFASRGAPESAAPATRASRRAVRPREIDRARPKAFGAAEPRGARRSSAAARAGRPAFPCARSGSRPSAVAPEAGEVDGPDRSEDAYTARLVAPRGRSLESRSVESSLRSPSGEP